MRIELENARLGVCTDRVFAVISARISRGVEKTRRPHDHVETMWVFSSKMGTSHRLVFPPFPLAPGPSRCKTRLPAPRQNPPCPKATPTTLSNRGRGVPFPSRSPLIFRKPAPPSPWTRSSTPRSSPRRASSSKSSVLKSAPAGRGRHRPGPSSRSARPKGRKSVCISQQTPFYPLSVQPSHCPTRCSPSL